MKKAVYAYIGTITTTTAAAIVNARIGGPIETYAACLIVHGVAVIAFCAAMFDAIIKED